MESATAAADDIDEDKLNSAARRLIDGVDKIAELQAGTRPPALEGNPACHYCPARKGCDEGIHYLNLGPTESHDQSLAL
jgi:hypothetical protein